MAAGWLKTGGRVVYDLAAQPLDKIRLQLKRLGLESEILESEKRLSLVDHYALTLGMKSTTPGVDSMKVADLSLYKRAELLRGSADPDLLCFTDNTSIWARFNEERSWIEYLLARSLPSTRLTKSTYIRGVMRGVHTDWAYRHFEDANDVIIDFKLDETGDETRDFMRIRSSRNVPFDRKWHQLKIGENLEVVLEK